jgi:parallel beta-helix repeat protein
MRFVLMGFWFTLLSASLLSSTIYVPDNFPTIQDAIRGAVNGDMIVVRAGTYTENINFQGKAVVLRSEKGPLRTVIDGTQKGTVVVFENNEDNNSVIEGFTITNGRDGITGGGGIQAIGASPMIRNNRISNNHSDSRGGGVYINGNQNTAIVENNRISNNYAIIEGGGICCYSGYPEIVGNLIGNNSAGSGGGAYLHSSHTRFIYNRIEDNLAINSGGGLYHINHSTAVFDRNVVVRNSCGSSGGGLYFCNKSHVTIVNNVIAANTSYWKGGGIFLDDSNPTVTNNTLFGNQAAETSSGKGGGIFCRNGCSPELHNLILWGNVAIEGPEIWIGSDGTAQHCNSVIGHSDVEKGQASVFVESGSGMIWGPGMIDTLPGFHDCGNLDFHLTWSSACRDTGDNSAPGLPLLADMEGDPRIVSGCVDIGADEYEFHLYAGNEVVPGSPIDINAVGYPTAPVMIFLSVNLAVKPHTTQYGDFYLHWPAFWQGVLGVVPANGILQKVAMVPAAWSPGEEYFIQSLIGPTGGFFTRLTNHVRLEVE